MHDLAILRSSKARISFKTHPHRKHSGKTVCELNAKGN